MIMKALLTIIFLVVLLFSTVQAGLKKNKIQKLASENQVSGRRKGQACRKGNECNSGNCSGARCT